MGKPAEEKAVTVVERRDNAIEGSIPELVAAFDQIGNNMATLGLNGWDAAQKTKAACWLAHGMKVHPAIFIQNHYCMVIDGKLMVEPKWEFIVATLESRVPGFRMEIIQEKDEVAEVRMSAPGKQTQGYTYTIEDARRQGLLNRKNAWAGGNTREMCFKQAVKRCGKRFSPASLMDLPISEDPVEAPEAEQQTPAQVLSNAVAAAVSGKEDATEVAFEEVPAAVAAAGAPAALDPDAKKKLQAKLKELYGGGLKPDAIAEKASLIYNELQKKKTGVDPGVKFTAKGGLGLAEAAQILEFLEARKAAGTAPRDASEGPGESGSEVRSGGAPGAPPDPGPPSSADDEAPPAEEPAAPQNTPLESLWLTVLRARKIFPPRQFITSNESKGLTLWWYVDQVTFKEAGYEKPVLLQKGEDTVAAAPALDQLNRILAEECDKKERGGR